MTIKLKNSNVRVWRQQIMLLKNEDILLIKYYTQRRFEKMLRIYLFACLLMMGLCIEMTPQEDKHTTIVESNHFFSDYEVSTSYSIDKVRDDRPIILVLKKTNPSATFDNNITIKLVSGSDQVECLFTSFNGLCYMKKIINPDMQLKLTCSHLPCEVSWSIFQPPLSELKSTDSVKELYDISESNQHMLAILSCNNPEITNFNQQVQAFSEDSFIRGSVKNLVYLLFPKEKTAHLYLRMQKEARSCAFMAIFQTPDALSENKQIRDFVFSNSSNVYALPDVSSRPWRIDMSMHELEKETFQSALNIQVTGEKQGVRSKIYDLSIKPDGSLSVYDFNYIVGVVGPDYSQIQLEVKSTNKILILNFQLNLTEQVEVEGNDHSYFSLHRGESIHYVLEPEVAAKPEEKVFFNLADQRKAVLNVRQCETKSGCSFDLQALDTVTSSIYINNHPQDEKETQVNFIPFTSSFTHKIREDDQIYLTKELIKDKAVQFVVNSPNIIVYAAPKDFCPTPTTQCYQKIANIHNPFIQQPKKDMTLQFLVKGLDNCQFTLTAIDEGSEAVPLVDGQPFSYLMDSYQFSLVFSFSNPDRKPVSFNLISPISDLILVVKNSNKIPKEDNDLVSRQGFISFSKKQVESQDFRILVKKTEEAEKKFVHFTIIATTSGAPIRLDPSLSHYETIKSEETRTYVFEFDKDEDYIVNFYMHNAPDGTVKVPLLVSNSNNWGETSVQHFVIDKPVDVLNLKDVSEELCRKEGEVSCEIWMKVVNSMEMEIDLTLTLLVQNSVLELKDGLWENFALNSIAKSSHFYFFPKASEHSVSIMYKSDVVDLQVVYNVWKSDQKGINPTEWPFPTPKKDKSDLPSIYQPVRHISIDAEVLKNCWPSCIILLSLYKVNTGSLNPNLLDPSTTNTFSIMAANQIIELPENTKLDILLKQNEDKFLFIDLKYAMDKEAVTVFTNSILGYYNLFANVYSEANPRYPEQYQSDFSFGLLETQIKISSIEKKIQENDMEDDRNLYLCLLAKSFQDSKFSIQYTTSEEIIKVLRMNTFENVNLSGHEKKYFQLSAAQQYELKFTRQKGYFYINFKECKKGSDYEECLQDFKDDDDKGKQIITKTEQFGQKPCDDCIVFVKIEAEQPSELMIHVQSKYAVVELKENDLISDFTNEKEENLYSVTSIQDEQAIINVEVLQGDPELTVTDSYSTFTIRKQKDEKTNMIHIVIPPVEKKKTDSPLALGGSYYDSYSLSTTFRYLQVKVSSKSGKLGTSYTITYSSGSREVYLEDGLMTGYTLEKDQQVTFFYNNPLKVEHALLTITFQKSSLVKKMGIKMYYFVNPNDEDTKVQFTPEKPPMRKKTPNPTITYSLPVKEKISIEIQSEQESKVSLIVNHQELILLPHNQQFPFFLQTNEDLNLLTDVTNPGYLLLTVRKCDESSPQLGYTFDYDAFQKSEFQSTISLEDEPKFQFFIRANKVGTLYANIHSPGGSSLLAVTVHYSSEKVSGDKNKAGNHGLMEYEIVESKKAKVTFSGITCTKSKCDKDVTYYWLSSDSLQEVYTQTVCPYSFFSTLDIKSDEPLEMNKIFSSPDSSNTISFEYPINQHISYVSVKAVVNGEEIYYQPKEIITLWGSLSRTTRSSSSWWLVIVGICGICACLVCVRRCLKAKPEYDPLSSEGDY